MASSSFAARLLKGSRNKAARILRRNTQNENEESDGYQEYDDDNDNDDSHRNDNSGRSNPAIAIGGTEMTEAAAAKTRTSSRTTTSTNSKAVKGSGRRSHSAQGSSASSAVSQPPQPPAASPDASLVHYYVCMPAGGLEAVTEEQAESHARRNEMGVQPQAPQGGGGYGDDNENGSQVNSLGGGSHQTHHERNMILELLHFARNRNWKKKVLTFLIVAVSLLVFYDLLFLGHIRTWIEAALEWMTLNPFGAVFSFILFFVVATLLFVPPAILMFGAGYAFSRTTESFVYGFFTSSIVSFVGCVLGAIAAFLRSRYMMRDLIELFSRRYPIVKALDRALERKGFRVMLLLRLCPIIPFNGLNHIGGVMNVSLENYTAALVGIIPTILLWCFCGASADRAMRVRVQEDGPQYMYAIILFSSGLAFGVIAAVLIWRFAIQELRKEIDEESAETWFRYKRHPSSRTTVQSDGSDEPSNLSTCGGDASVEAGREFTLQEHEAATWAKRRRGILAWLRIEAEDYGLDTYYEGPDDGRDEEWYWLWA